MLRHEQLLRAADAVAVNQHRELYALGLEPSYIAESVQVDAQSVELGTVPEAVGASSELGTDVQGGVSAARIAIPGLAFVRSFLR